MDGDDTAVKAEVSRLRKSQSANKYALSGLIVKANAAVTNDDKDGVESKLALIKGKARLIELLNEKIDDK